MKTTNTLIPFAATHPGVLIKDELEARKDINQKGLATLLGIKPSFLNEIIKGKRSITADFAILLEKSLDIPADYWMRFQSQYEIDVAKIKKKNIRKIELIELWSVIKKYVPVQYFIKKGYLSDDLEYNINRIKEIYSVHSIDNLIAMFSEKKFAFYKKSGKLQMDEKNMIAWSSLVAYEAKNKPTNTFSYNNIERLIIELNTIFYHNENTIHKVEKILSQYGIKFLIIDKLEKTPIDGYSFWSNNNPVIATTVRHSRIDNFAFTIMHELGHIVLHLKENKDQYFWDLTTIQESKVEEEANTFAQQSLINPNLWAKMTIKNSSFTDEKIMEMATTYKINPAIIIGRISFEQNNYTLKTTIDKKLK